MSDETENIIKKLVEEARFLCGMRKYYADDEVDEEVLDEHVVKYASEKSFIAKNRLVSSIKTKIDLNVASNILTQLNALSDEELNTVANKMFKTFSVFNSTKEEEFQKAKSRNDSDKMASLCKKNNTYVCLLEIMGTFVVERMIAKKDFSLLQGFSTCVLKFILKEAFEQKVRNSMRVNNVAEHENANRINEECEKVIIEIESELKSRGIVLNENANQNYERRIEALEMERLKRCADKANNQEV